MQIQALRASLQIRSHPAGPHAVSPYHLGSPSHWCSSSRKAIFSAKNELAMGNLTKVTTSPLTGIKEATRAYECWLAGHLSLLPADLKLKHQRMAESPFAL